MTGRKRCSCHVSREQQFTCASNYTSRVGAENPAQCGHSLLAKNTLIKFQYNTERGVYLRKGIKYMHVHAHMNKKEHDLSMEQVPGVIAPEDELIVLALLTCTFSKICQQSNVRLTRGCKLPNLDERE